MALAVLGVMIVATVVGVVAMDDDGAADAAVGYDFTLEGVTYRVIADDEVEIRDSISDSISGDFEIPSTVSDGTVSYSVTTIYDRAFEYCDMTSLIIPDSVTSIGSYVFNVCSSLTSVTIPNSWTSISNNTFSGCSSLVSVTIPESVTSIDTYAFNECSALTSVSIPSSVTSINDSAFLRCSSLTSVTIPESVTSIGGNVFAFCSSLKSVIIPNSVTTINSYTFSGCSSLTSVTIPESVTSIGSYAFEGCSSMTSATFSVQESPTFGSHSFDTGTILCVTSSWDPVIAMADAHDGDTTILWVNNPSPEIGDLLVVGELVYVMTAEGEVSVAYPISVSISGDIVIPPTITVETNSFTVTSIGSYAFEGCSSLTSVTISESVTSIWDGAFIMCTSMESVTIPASLDSICAETFIMCSSLTSINIPSSVTTIGGGAFMQCDSLTSVTFGSESAPTFGPYSFITGTTINVYTPGWDPTQVMTGDVITSPAPDQFPSSTVVWANAPSAYPDLTFESDPVADGIIAYITNKTS